MFGQSQERWLGTEYFSPMQNAVMDGVDLAHLVQQGKASPTELLEDAIARADSLNPQLNAIIHRLDEQARARAAKMSDQRASEEATLWGVPFLTKDLTVSQLLTIQMFIYCVPHFQYKKVNRNREQ